MEFRTVYGTSSDLIMDGFRLYRFSPYYIFYQWDQYAITICDKDIEVEMWNQQMSLLIVISPPDVCPILWWHDGISTQTRGFAKFYDKTSCCLLNKSLQWNWNV